MAVADPSSVATHRVIARQRKKSESYSIGGLKQSGGQRGSQMRSAYAGVQACLDQQMLYVRVLKNGDLTPYFSTSDNLNFLGSGLPTATRLAYASGVRLPS